MIYNYTSSRAQYFKRLLLSIPKHKQARLIVFAYGDTAFKFIVGNKVIEVSRYDEEIIIRRLSTKLV